MPWTAEGDDLRLVGDLHFSYPQFRRLLDDLRNATEISKRVCSDLENGVQNRLVVRNTIWRLSKWCDWSRARPERIAREIGNLLFGIYPQPRFLDQSNRQVPEAQVLYEDWRQKVLGKAYLTHSPGGTPMSRELYLLVTRKQIILYGPPGTGKTYSTKRRAVSLIDGFDFTNDLKESDQLPDPEPDGKLASPQAKGKNKRHSIDYRTFELVKDTPHRFDEEEIFQIIRKEFPEHLAREKKRGKKDPVAVLRDTNKRRLLRGYLQKKHGVLIEKDAAGKLYISNLQEERP